MSMYTAILGKIRLISSATPFPRSSTIITTRASFATGLTSNNSYKTFATMASTSKDPKDSPSKKLIVLCDGTWQNSDRGWVKDHFWSIPKPQVPSNVTRIARAIKAQSDDHIPQVIYYQAGVGTSWSIADRVFGGGLALGLGEHVREAYGFIAHNYAIGRSGVPDQIFLLGFSRGAFTARSVGGMISKLGLLNKSAMEHFYLIFEDFENAGKPGYEIKIKSVFPDFTVTHEPNSTKKYLRDYRDQLHKHGLTRDVDIKAIAVWDTVGTLGLPIHPWLQKLGFASAIRKYRFFDTGISKHVENAFHALALDERRAAFDATVWERQDDNDKTNLMQVWFAGAHSNIGGSYEDSNAADLSLAWMVDQLTPFIDFNTEYVIEQFERNLKKYYTLQGEAHKDKLPEWRWGAGTINEGLQFPTSLGGATTRSPGRYYKLDYLTGQPNPRHPELLQDTNEYVHSSVRARYEVPGNNAHGKPYQPAPALEHWKLINDGDDKVDGGSGLPVWKYENKNAPKDPANNTILPEAPLGVLESILLNRDVETKKLLFESLD